MLHSQIQNIILRNKVIEGNAKQHLILITGDGNANGNRTTFPDIVSLAIQYGWTVDIWSWTISLSAKFRDIQQNSPNKIRINYLDVYRPQITFRQKQRQEDRIIPIKSFSYAHALLAGIIFILVLFIYYFLF